MVKQKDNIHILQ